MEQKQFAPCTMGVRLSANLGKNAKDDNKFFLYFLSAKLLF